MTVPLEELDLSLVMPALTHNSTPEIVRDIEHAKDLLRAHEYVVISKDRLRYLKIEHAIDLFDSNMDKGFIDRTECQMARDMGQQLLELDAMTRDSRTDIGLTLLLELVVGVIMPKTNDKRPAPEMKPDGETCISGQGPCDADFQAHLAGHQGQAEE